MTKKFPFSSENNQSRTYTLSQFNILWEAVKERYAIENPYNKEIIVSNKPSQTTFLAYLRKFEEVNSVLLEKKGLEGQSIGEAIKDLQDSCDLIKLSKRYAEALTIYAINDNCLDVDTLEKKTNIDSLIVKKHNIFKFENAIIQETSKKLNTYLEFQSENGKRESHSNWSLEFLYANTLIDDITQAEWDKILETSWKDKLGFMIFDDILFGHDCKPEKYSENLSTNTKLKIDKIRRNRNDFPFWYRSLIVSALILSLIYKPTTEKLAILFDFVEANEQFVWKKALLGIVLIMVNNSELVFNDIDLFERWEGFKKNPIKAETLSQIFTELKPKNVKKIFENDQYWLIKKWIDKSPFDSNPSHWYLPFFQNNEISNKIPSELSNLLYNTNSFGFSILTYLFCINFEKMPIDTHEKTVVLLKKHQEKNYNNFWLKNYHSQNIANAYLEDTEIGVYVIEFLVFLKEFKHNLHTNILDSYLNISINQLYSIDSLNLNSAYAFYNLGNHFLEVGESLKAIECFERTIQLDKNTSWFTYEKIYEAYRNMGEWDKAIDSVNTLLSIDKKYDYLSFYIGHILYLKGENEESKQFFERYVTKYPKSYTAFFWLGLCYFNENSYGEALIKLQNAISIYPDFYEPYFRIGNIYVELEQSDLATNYISNGFEMKFKGKESKTAKSYEELENEASVAMEKQNYGAAIISSMAIIDTLPSKFNAWTIISLAYDKIGDSKQAKKKSEIALSFFPTNLQIIYNLVYLYLKDHDIDSAIKLLLKLIDEHPDAFEELKKLGDNSFELYYLLGDHYSIKKDYNQAILYYEQAIKVKPDSHEVLHLLGEQYRHKKEFDTAISFFKQAIKISPDKSISWNNWGYCLFCKGDFAEAKEVLSYLVSFGMRDFGNKNIGHVELCLRNKEKAIEHYILSLSNFKDFNTFLEIMNKDYQILSKFGIKLSYFNAILGNLKIQEFNNYNM
jgi:tetratricopeptide (TPR) repeat protein